MSNTLRTPWDGIERRLSPEPFFGTDRRQTPSFAAARTRALEKYGTIVFLGMLMLFVTTLSVAIVSKESIRLDEAQSLWQTAGTPVGILHTIAKDVHVPLYHLTLHYWRAFLGSDIGIARMLSLVFFLAMIPAMYHLGKISYNRTAGMLTAFLIAVSPFLNWYGSEARMYSMLAFFTVLNQYFFVRIMKGEQGNIWAGYILTAILGVYTHYFFGFALISQGVFFLLRRHIFPEGSFRKFVMAAAAIGLSLLPWLMFVRSLGSASNTRPQLIPPSSVDLFNTFSEFIFGFHTDHLNTAIVSLWPIAIFLAFFALRRGVKMNPETLYFVIAMTVPIIGAFALSWFVRPVFVARYLILALPSLYLVVSWLFSTYPERLAFAAKTFLISAMVFTLALQTVSASTPVKENYRSATEYLNAHATPRDVIILSAPFTIYPVEYYYNGTAALRTLPIWNRYQIGPIPAFSEATLPREVEELKASHEYAWLLLSYDQGYEETIRMYFDTHFERVEAREFSEDLTLYKYKLRYDEVRGLGAWSAPRTTSLSSDPYSPF